MKKYNLKINGNDYNVKIVDFSVENAEIEVNGTKYDIEIKYDESDSPVIVPKIKSAAAPQMAAAMPGAAAPAGAKASANGKTVNAPMPGLMLQILVKVGASVSPGQKVATMEAMKMENDINTTVGGSILEIMVKEGDNVQENEVLFVIG